MKNKFFAIMVLATSCSTLVMALAGSAFVREYRAAIVTRGSDLSILREINQYEKSAGIPHSTRGIREIVSLCATRSGKALLGTVDDTDRDFRGSCERIIDAILLRNPTSARALSARLVLKESPTATDVALAQASAPYEPWPLGTRLLLLDQRPDLFSQFPEAFAQDLGRGFQSTWGVNMISGLYLRNESLRDTIAKAAEGAPAELKERFLANLKKGNGNG